MSATLSCALLPVQCRPQVICVRSAPWASVFLPLAAPPHTHVCVEACFAAAIISPALSLGSVRSTTCCCVVVWPCADKDVGWPRGKLGTGPDPAPRPVGNLIAKLLTWLGPKGLEFGRYSIDYHNIRCLHPLWLWCHLRSAHAAS